MNITRHAAARQQQRGIPPLVVDLLLEYGKAKYAGAGATKYYWDKQSRKRLEAYAGPLAGIMAKHLDCFIVVSADGHLITAAHRTERIKH